MQKVVIHRPGGYDHLRIEQHPDLAPVGKLVVYGFHSMLPRKGGRPNRLQLLWDYTRTPRFNPFSLTTRNRRVLGFNLSFLFDRSEILHEAMEQLEAALEEFRGVEEVLAVNENSQLA